MSIAILHGRSDDLIEVDGCINEEWTCYLAGEDTRVRVGDVIFKMWYDDDGRWRIENAGEIPDRYSVSIHEPGCIAGVSERSDAAVVSAKAAAISATETEATGARLIKDGGKFDD
jgi:hypothetical protein